MKKKLYITIAISILIATVSFLILLNLFFTDDFKVETYICFVNDNGSHYHYPYCSYTKKESKQTTIYEAQKDGYRLGNCCDPLRNDRFKTTIDLREQNYIPPAIISIAIATVAFFVIKQKYTEK